jgi:hypothetical protein
MRLSSCLKVCSIVDRDELVFCIVVMSNWPTVAALLNMGMLMMLFILESS